MRRVVLLLPVLMSCGAVSFNIETDLAQQTVQGSVLGGVLPSFLPTSPRLDVDLKAEVARRGTGPVKKALLKELTLSITPHASPVGNFDFINEVHLFVEAPGVTKAEIAKLNPVPRSATKLTFDIVPDVDLLPFINAGATITATASGTQPNMDTSFDGHVVIEARI